MEKVRDMLKTISALKARKNLGELLEEVYYRGDQYIIERAGKPMAAVVPLAQLDAWQKRRDAFFGMVDETREKTRKTKAATLEKEVAEAVRSVRTRTSR
jgi:prevent-host-death family protein